MLNTFLYLGDETLINDEQWDQLIGYLDDIHATAANDQPTNDNQPVFVYAGDDIPF